MNPSIDPFFFEIGTNACSRSRYFCNICAIRPYACYPIYDPWWWLKCPQCGITIYINPGDEVERVSIYDSLGKQVGVFQKLARPLVENGVSYTYAAKLKVSKGVGYVMKAESAKQKAGSFMPAVAVKLQNAR